MFQFIVAKRNLCFIKSKLSLLKDRVSDKKKCDVLTFFPSSKNSNNEIKFLPINILTSN